MATFKFSESGKKSYISTQEVVEKIKEIHSLINQQETLLNKAKTDYARKQIQTNITILKDSKKFFEEELEKDPEYQLIKKSNDMTDKYYNSSIKYIGENKNKNCFDAFYD